MYILPFVEQRRLYDEFHTEEPWDSPHNRKLIARMPEVYEDESAVLFFTSGTTGRPKAVDVPHRALIGFH